MPMLNDVERRERDERLRRAREIERAEPTTKSEGFFIGVDLGQSHDFTAIAVVERVKRTSFAGWVDAYTDRVDLNDPLHGKQPTYKDDIEYHVRHIERVRLGTSYNDVVRHLYTLVTSPPLCEVTWVMAIDAGGVGRAMFDMLEEAGMKSVTAVTTTAGETTRRDGARWNVPKQELISCLKDYSGATPFE